MKFNKDYKEFLDHLEKSNQKAQIKTKLSKCERTAILLFVAYLNIRHQNLPHNKALHMTPKVEPKCTCHPHDLAYYGCRCK